MTQYELNKDVCAILEALALEIQRLYDGEVTAFDLTATRNKINSLQMFSPGDEAQYE